MKQCPSYEHCSVWQQSCTNLPNLIDKLILCPFRKTNTVSWPWCDNLTYWLSFPSLVLKWTVWMFVGHISKLFFFFILPWRFSSLWSSCLEVFQSCLSLRTQWCYFKGWLKWLSPWYICNSYTLSPSLHYLCEYITRVKYADQKRVSFLVRLSKLKCSV